MDRPALEKQQRVIPPGGSKYDKGVPYTTNYDASGSDFSGWDVSRQIKVRAQAGLDLHEITASPQEEVVPKDFPDDSTFGNDDVAVEVDEDDNPYVGFVAQIGQLASYDSPTVAVDDRLNSSFTFSSTDDKLHVQYRFREFVRVQIGMKWYRCSDSNAGLWRLFVNLAKTSGQWHLENFNADADITFDLLND